MALELNHEDIRQRFMAGETLRSIASDLGVTFGRIGQITRALGLRRHAAPPAKDPRDPKSRFECKIDHGGPIRNAQLGRCWNWIGAQSRGKRGPPYGHFIVDGRIRKAHAAAFFFEHGRWPDPQCLHHCDNPLCVRPSHLFEGTQADNMADMRKKGRAVIAHGINHHRAKLSEDDVRRARALRAEGSTYASIAELLGISVGHAHRVCNDVAWQHVPFPGEKPAR